MTLRTLLTASLSLLLAVPALAAPTKLAQQGRVLDSSGEALEGTHAMSFSLFDAATDGSSLWSEERNAAFEAGYYAITLGEQVPLDDLLFAGESVWLEISIGGEALTPRQEVVSVPYALRATAAEHVEGGMVDAEEISVDGTVVIDASGNWVGPTPAVGWGDLSGVPADIADGDQDSDTLAGLACAEGQLPKWDATASLWVCGDDTDTTDPNTDTLQSLACATGQIAKWDGTAWSCGEDVDTLDPNTDVLAGLACAEGQLPKWDATNSLWVCGDDIDTDTTDPNTDTLAGLACAEGQLPKWDATNSLWVCGDDIDTDTTEPNTDTLLTLVCTAGQVAKWDGTSWACGDDVDTDTTDPNTDTLLGLPCAAGFIAKMDGTTGLWDCAPDADSFAELAGVCLPGDIPVLDPVSGSWTCGLDNDTVTSSLPWSSITGIPADIADGDQDTVTLTLPWSSITGIPADIADGDQDTVTLTLPWSSITGVPTEIADGDQDSLGALSCNDGEGASWNQSTQSWECAPEATELDPVFAASTAAGITPSQVTNWDMAHGWGDHAAQGYVTSTSESDPVFTGSEASGITATNTTNWNTAHSWGDHSTQGYISSEVDPSFSASEASGITATQTSNWNTAHSWGDHATQGYLTTEVLETLNCADGQLVTYQAASSSWACVSLIAMLDGDGDGVILGADCNDSDPNTVNDMDCDGVLTAADCDDSDPLSTVIASDGDCDGVATTVDCDDSDASVTSTNQTDTDCDGSLNAADCNDNDPSIFPLAGDFYGDGIDSDCDGYDCEAELIAPGIYFAACTTLFTWPDSQSVCQAGGHDGLVTIENSAQNQDAIGLANQVQPNQGFFIGFLDQVSGQSWASGMPVTFSDMWTSQPSQDYVQMEPMNHSRPRQWNDVDAIASLNRICETRF